MNGDFIKTVTDGQSGTEIYEVLQAFYKDDSSPLYSENEKAEDMVAGAAENEAIKSESVMDGIFSVLCEITLVTADSTETVYLVNGNTVENQATGERVVLTAEQLAELKDVLNVK